MSYLKIPLLRGVSICLMVAVFSSSTPSNRFSYLAPPSLLDEPVSVGPSQGHSFKHYFPLWFILMFLVGCHSMPPAQRARYITDQIDLSIKKKEWGNSYDIAEMAEERHEEINEMVGSGLSRFQIATRLGLVGERRDLFVLYGILVDGNKSDEDLKKIKLFLEKIPPSHLPAVHTILMGIRFSRIYDRDKSGRYYFWEGRIIGFIHTFVGKKGVPLSSLAHEWGHAVDFYLVPFLEGKWYWALHLFFSWGKNAYATEYGGSTHWEDFAEIYEAWVEDSLTFLSKRSDNAKGYRFHSRVLLWKTLMLLRHFIIKKEGKYYLRAYRHGEGSQWSEKWKNIDILLDIQDPSELDEEDLQKVLKILKRPRSRRRVSYRFFYPKLPSLAAFARLESSS